MSDELKYEQKKEEAWRAYEALCKRCGFCCGGGGSDPCANLARDKGGLYYCLDYEHRFGAQKSVSGITFTCIEIGIVLQGGIPNPDCGYVARSGGSAFWLNRPTESIL